jgi:hypothetical protein
LNEAHTERKRLDHGFLRITAGGGPVQRGEKEFSLAPHHLFEQVIFGRKAPVAGAAADPGAGGDGFDVRPA